MKNTFLKTPKLLAMNEGNSYQMLSHILTTKITGDDTDGEWAMFEMTDTAEHGAPLHSHPWHETFYILEGEMELQIGKRKALATAGALMHVPANTIHTFKVCSSSVRVLVMVSPASAEAFYQEIGEKITVLPPDPNLFQEVCSKYGVRIFQQ
jgi:quercetin dioxygenase-like cupin family protein